MGNTAVQASDPTGIYAIVDKVVLEPNEGKAERIQIWGVFTVAEGRGRTYGPATNGFLYFKLKPGKEETSLKEWNDLKSVAGTSQIIGFASRFQETGTVRKSDAKVENPDVYPLGYGMVKIDDGGRPDYQPVRELRAARPKKDQKPSSSGKTEKSPASK